VVCCHPFRMRPFFGVTGGVACAQPPANGFDACGIRSSIPCFRLKAQNLKAGLRSVPLHDFSVCGDQGNPECDGCGDDQAVGGVAMECGQAATGDANCRRDWLQFHGRGKVCRNPNIEVRAEFQATFFSQHRNFPDRNRRNNAATAEGRRSNGFRRAGTHPDPSVSIEHRSPDLIKMLHSKFRPCW